MSFNTCIDSCDHHRSQNEEQFHHPEAPCSAALCGQTFPKLSTPGNY